MPPQRFWQWNRYQPAVECNAAMRDGNWKLVLPAIDELMQVAPADLAMDIESKYRPERFVTLVETPEPERVAAAAAPSQLFDLRSDPLEQHDLAAEHPERVRRMEAELGAWFAEVEEERRSIGEQ